MTKKNGNIENPRRNKRLHASVRFVVALILQLWMMYYFTHEGAVGGADAANDKLKEFLLAFVPTIIILFLLPVIIRGSRSQKIIAIVLSLLPAWMAFSGWMNVFSGG